MQEVTIKQQYSYNAMGGAQDPRWKCCCASMHVKTGATVIGVLGVIGAIMYTFTTIYTHGSNGGLDGMGWSQLIGGLLSLLSNGLVLLGVYKSNAAMLIMQQVMQVLCMIAACIGIVAVIVACVMIGMAMAGEGMKEGMGPEEYPEQLGWLLELGTAVLLMIGVALLVCLVVQIWFFRVLLRCREYLQMMETEMTAIGVRVTA